MCTEIHGKLHDNYMLKQFSPTLLRHFECCFTLSVVVPCCLNNKMLFVLLIRATESLFQSFHVFCMLAFKHMRQDGSYSILGQRLIHHFQIPFFL